MEINTRTELPLLLKHFGLPLTAIEVGVAGASNAADLLRNGIEHIYLVENWATIPNVTGDGSFNQQFHDENYHEAMYNLRLFEGKYTILEGLSAEMHKFIPNNSVGLFYHDGDHNYKGVKEDIENFYLKLVPNGIIAFHGYPNYEDVYRAVNEFADSKGLEIHIIPEDCMQNAGCWVRI